MKAKFEMPEITVVSFAVEDVITTSDNNIGSFDGPWVPIKPTD